MGKISILPAPSGCGREAANSIANVSMPTFYMEDYSVLAILVKPFQKAVKMVEKKGFQVIREELKTEINFRGTSDLREIFSVFQTGGIEYGMSDIVDSVYQG